MVTHELQVRGAEICIDEQVLPRGLEATMLARTVILEEASTCLDDGVRGLEASAVLLGAFPRVLPLDFELTVDVKR